MLSYGKAKQVGGKAMSKRQKEGRRFKCGCAEVEKGRERERVREG